MGIKLIFIVEISWRYFIGEWTDKKETWGRPKSGSGRVKVPKYSNFGFPNGQNSPRKSPSIVELELVTEGRQRYKYLNYMYQHCPVTSIVIWVLANLSPFSNCRLCLLPRDLAASELFFNFIPSVRRIKSESNIPKQAQKRKRGRPCPQQTPINVTLHAYVLACPLCPSFFFFLDPCLIQ